MTRTCSAEVPAFISHSVPLPRCCPVSGNPAPGSTLRVSYLPKGVVLPVEDLTAWVREFVDGHPSGIREMEAMIQDIARQTAQAVGVPVRAVASLKIDPPVPGDQQTMRVTARGIPATPMPNATGTETQLAPMVEAEPVAWGAYLADGRFLDIASSDKQTAVDMAGFHYEDDEFTILPLHLHPAPATLADEMLRAENERLRAERDAIRDSLIETQAAQRGLDIRVQETADEFIRLKRDRDRAESEAEEYCGQSEKLTKALDEMTAIKDIHAEKRHEQFERAEAAEAKLAALSQPAPVVEDGTAREHHCKSYVPDVMAGGSDCRNCGHPQEVHATLAPEGQNAEAWLKLDAALATAPAVPDGRTEEVEKLLEFAKWAIREGAFTGSDIGGWEIQEKAVAMGLLRGEPYEPKRHGEIEFTEPGLEIFVFTAALSERRT